MENLELIGSLKLFKGLDEGQLKKFQEIAKEEDYPAGSIIIEENTEGRALFIVKRGTVAVTKIDGALESEIVKLFAGEHFGEMSLVEDAKTSARVSAYNDVVCLVIPRDAFSSLLDSNDKIAATVYKAFTQTLCDRLRNTSQDLVAWKPDFQV
jgi:CRP/FNR family transcriptional regulator, cyclic AMP receptor protein